MISRELADRNFNLKCISYLQNRFHNESDDLKFIEWLDTGMMSLHLWGEICNYASSNKTSISIDSFVEKITHSSLISDFSYWLLNFQNYRGRFNDFFIDEVVIRIEHLMLRLEKIVVKYKKLIG